MGYPLGKTNTDFHLANHRSLVAVFAVTCTLTVVACAYTQKEELPALIASLQPPPPWAYAIQPPVQAPPDDGIPKRVPGSAAAITLTEIRDLLTPTEN